MLNSIHYTASKLNTKIGKMLKIISILTFFAISAATSNDSENSCDYLNGQGNLGHFDTEKVYRKHFFYRLHIILKCPIMTLFSRLLMDHLRKYLISNFLLSMLEDGFCLNMLSTHGELAPLFMKITNA